MFLFFVVVNLDHWTQQPTIQARYFIKLTSFTFAKLTLFVQIYLEATIRKPSLYESLLDVGHDVVLQHLLALLLHHISLTASSKASRASLCLTDVTLITILILIMIDDDDGKIVNT